MEEGGREEKPGYATGLVRNKPICQDGYTMHYSAQSEQPIKVTSFDESMEPHCAQNRG